MKSPNRSTLIFIIFLAAFCFYSFETFGPRTDNGPTTSNDFVNFETPHVYPMDMTPNQQKLLAVNTADNRLEVFTITDNSLDHLASIPVGMDPVTVRVRNNNEAWVVNHLSDNISIVDLNLNIVTKTIRTDNEPCDIVFSSSAQRAFVTCSEANSVNVFNLSNLNSAPQQIVLKGEEPRSLAISPDGNTVYAGFFMSGNQTTIVPGGKTEGPQNGRAQDAVRHPSGPYGGLPVPPNNGNSFNPPISSNLPSPPAVSIIVKKNTQGQWLDDNNGNWTSFISGSLANESHRIQGWDLPDRDVAILNANNLSVSYKQHLMNILMALSVNPATGEITVVGTDATNEIRYEPNLNGRFMRINWAKFQGNSNPSIKDMNPHLNYALDNISQSERNLAISDPRGSVWNNAGTRCFVTGMGTDNMIILDQNGNRISNQPIEVGEGPTGIVLHETSARAFVMNKFSGSISIVNLNSQSEVAEVNFYDPTPDIIKRGRPHLYNSHENSGLGHISCASCHIDARTDRLAWDLGDPQGEVTFPEPGTQMEGAPFTGFHPMKGPFRTQILQDINRYESLHWRGDRKDLFDFAEAYKELQGDDEAKPTNEMAEFSAFLSTIHFPPNPYRNLDNSISNSVPVPGPNNTIAAMANPNNAINTFLSACLSCHPGHRGRGAQIVENFLHDDIHQVPETFRGFYERSGFFSNTTDGNTQGFGKLPDGSEFFNLGDLSQSQQSEREMAALLMSFDGGVPWSDEGDHPSLDAHAAVGQQVTVNGSISNADQNLLNQFINLANTDAVGLIAKGVFENEFRSFVYLGDNLYQSDAAEQTITQNSLMANVLANGPMTFTVVPFNTRYRMGIDRDSDGIYDWDEDNSSNQAVANSLTITADDSYELYFNGVLIGENNVWQTAEIYNQLAVRPGKNVIAIRANNQGGPGAVIAELNRNGIRSGTNNQWKATNQFFNNWKEIEFNDNNWPNAADYGGFGGGAWQNNVIGIADDTPARWIWTSTVQENSSVFLRFSFTGSADQSLDLCNGEILLADPFENGLGNWSSTGNATIQNETLQLSSASQFQSTTGSNWSNYVYKLKFNIINGTAGIVFRKVDNNNFYLWQFSENGTLRAQKNVNGGINVLKTIDIGTNKNADYNIAIVVEGNIIKTYLNNQLVDVTSDGSFSQGRVGLSQCNNCGESASFDNIQVCALSTPSVDCDWNLQAQENESFTVNEPTLVRYGIDGFFYYRTLNGTINCSNSTFGDPIFGIEKSCSVCDGDITQQSQFITFNSITDKFTTDNNFNLSASASSGLPVQFELLSGPASIAGNTIILNGTTGIVTIRATQNGNSNWLPANPVTQSFEVINPPDPGECDTPENVALNKVATQSSVSQGGVASRAVDGNTNGVFYDQFSVAHTSWENESWWEVDLGETYDIESINIWNRTDCCFEFLDNYYILISDIPFESQDLVPTINQAGVSNFYQAGQAQTPSAVNIERSGRYVRIQLNKSAFIGLAEVEVMGCPSGSNPPPPPTNDPPIVNFVSPNNQQTFSEGNNISVEASANDTDGSVTKVDLFFNNQFVRSELQAPYNWNAPGQNDELLQNLSIGTHELRVVATDDDGATSAETITIIVTESEGPPSCNGITNLALNKQSTQSSMQQGGIASRANDGNTNGVFYSQYSVSLTNWENQAWWEIDLENIQDIETINLWNREDCCSEWLTNFYVLVSDVPFSSTGLNEVLNQPGVSSFFQADQVQFPTGININRTGRYVRIQLLGSAFLGLAEVEIMGCQSNASQGQMAVNNSFVANRGTQPRTVDLNWTVDESKQPRLYTLEHSANGTSYQTIKQGLPETSTEFRNYKSLHTDPVDRSNYYRLRVDFPSGAYEYIYSDRVYFNEFKELVNVFPNPTSDFVIVDLSKLKAPGLEVEVQLYDLKGTLMLQQKIDTETETLKRIDLTQLQGGLYNLYLNHPNRKSIVYPIIKSTL